MNSEAPLRRGDILKLMAAAAAPFSVRVVTANRTKKTGGRLLALANHYLAGHKPGAAPAPRGAKAGAVEPGNEARPRKAPNHQENGTINLICALTGAVTKVHTVLITTFCGRAVTI